jgi:hypothetical protein
MQAKSMKSPYISSVVACAATLATALGLVACGPSGGGGGTGAGSGTGGGGGSTGGGGQPQGPTAIAELASQITWGSGSGPVGDAGAVDPATLYVRIANGAPSCGDPSVGGCSQGAVWEVDIGIPPALQVAGVLQLSNAALTNFVQFARPLPGDNNGQCASYGEDAFTQGTIEIVSISAATIVVKLAGTSTTTASADGEYTAPRCPG